jgi:MerR family transcriptional regulator, light-induced transcriptional regulator
MNDQNKVVSRLIVDHQEVLAQISVDRQLALQPEYWHPMDQVRYQKSIRDAVYHFSYLADALATNNSSLFVDYAAWIKVLFAGLKFQPHVLPVMFQCMTQAIKETLAPEDAAAACEYLDIALVVLPQLPEMVESFFLPEAPHYRLATNYFEALLSGDRPLGSRLVQDAILQGTGIREIYRYVFQPCQQEVGRLWQMNRITVAQEHYCSVATQIIMSQISSYTIPFQRIGRRLVATSVSGELHEIGVRMVADFLEMEGWDCYYLGANTPSESIIRAIEERHTDVLAISATISYHVSRVADLIERVRSSSNAARVKIMVGGYPFNITSDLWQQVGADGYARDAQDAVAVANRLAG